MNQKALLIVAVVLIVVAVLLIGRQATSREGMAVKPRSIEEQVREIENNPKMPEQAKAIAIGQLRARARQPAAAPSGP